MNKSDERKLGELRHQHQLFEESSKEEIWHNMKSASRGMVAASYCAGCAVSLAIFGTEFSFSIWLLLKFLITAVTGAIFAIPIFAVLFFLLGQSSALPSMKRNLLTALLVPAGVLLLVWLLTRIPH